MLSPPPNANDDSGFDRLSSTPNPTIGGPRCPYGPSPHPLSPGMRPRPELEGIETQRSDRRTRTNSRGPRKNLRGQRVLRRHRNRGLSDFPWVPGVAYLCDRDRKTRRLCCPTPIGDPSIRTAKPVRRHRAERSPLDQYSNGKRLSSTWTSISEAVVPGRGSGRSNDGQQSCRCGGASTRPLDDSGGWTLGAVNRSPAVKAGRHCPSKVPTAAPGYSLRFR